MYDSSPEHKANTAVEQTLTLLAQATTQAEQTPPIMAQSQTLSDKISPILAQAPPLTAWNLLAATGALLAFLIGVYTLAGRERKAPYLINSVFAVFLLCLLGAAFDIGSALFPSYQDEMLKVGAGLLLLAILLTFGRVYRLYARFSLFVDSLNPRHLPIWRALKELRRKIWPKANYAHDPQRLSIEDEAKVLGVLREMGLTQEWERRPSQELSSVAIAVDRQGHASNLLLALAKTFLERGFPVQYTNTSRHPLEFIKFLKSSVPEDMWSQWARLIVVVDAFTPHFGFTDSIHQKNKREIELYGVHCITSSASYAGMHSAASYAFHAIRKKLKEDVRKPALMIYEDSYALTDLESPEQYRIFVRHVIPSERAFGGMLTIFVESSPPDADWRLLSSCASVTLDLRAARQPSGTPKA